MHRFRGLICLCALVCALCIVGTPGIAFADPVETDVESADTQGTNGASGTKTASESVEKQVVSTTSEEVTVETTETGDDGCTYNVVRCKLITTTVFSDGSYATTEQVLNETKQLVKTEETTTTTTEEPTTKPSGDQTDPAGASGGNQNVQNVEQPNGKPANDAGQEKGEPVYKVHFEQGNKTVQAQSSGANVTPQAEKAPSVTIQLRTHIQNIGWRQGWRQTTSTASKASTVSAGTSGRALRLEALQIALKGVSGSISYQVHVQNIGWQAVMTNGSIAGTSGRSLRLEAIRIALTGEVSKWYDIEYRTHVQNVGWQGFVRNGAVAGTTGRGLRLEALDIRLVPKANKSQSGGEGIVGVRSQAHVQNVGNQAWVRDGSVMGTTGRSLRMEAIRLQLDKGIYPGSIEYRTHIQNIGWTGWSRDGQLSGTTGRSLRMEAVQIRLKGNIAKTFEVVYRAHVQNIGWQDWMSGNNVAGTTGRSLRMEALQVQLIRRPSVPTPQRIINDGVYALKVQSSQGNAVGAAGASNASGANVQLVSDANWRLEEKWQITWKGNGYELVNLNSGKVLDALNGHVNMVANVRQANRNNSKSQRWAIIRNGNGYYIAGMNFGSVLQVQDGKLSSGGNLHLWAPNGSNAQRFAVVATEAFYAGTYQMFTKLDQSGKCIDVPNGSVSNGTQLVIGYANDGPNQHFTFAKNGNGFTIQAVSSGKYLTVSGNNVVQTSRNNAATQIWRPVVSGAGGLVFVNSSTGRVLSVQGNRNANAVGLQQLGRSDVAGQRWYPVGRSLVSNGLYELRTAPAFGVVLDVNGGSISSGANLEVYSRNSGNNQKFSIIAVGGGYYRIGMPLGRTVVTVQGSSKGNQANVRMENWNNSAAQLWRPVVTDGGLVFVNKNSGKALSFTAAKSGANVRQVDQSGSSLQKWSVVKTNLNIGDMQSYVKAVQMVSGAGGVRLNNAVAGYSISNARWNQLMRALNACWGAGYDLGFVMLDCNTGMTVSLDPYRNYFGASTIKGLYVTYLFQEYLEKGRLSWGEISGLAYDTIVWSDNDAYRALRASYGSEDGFASWLGRAGVGYLGLWETYSAKTLASAWLNMLQYSESGGRYVGTWKSLFNHSDYSSIHERLGGYRNTYSKPGWMDYGTWSGPITNDAALVDDRNGRKYVLAIMSSVEPYGDRYLIRDVVAALDAIHMEMPRSR